MKVAGSMSMQLLAVSCVLGLACVLAVAQADSKTGSNSSQTTSTAKKSTSSYKASSTHHSASSHKTAAAHKGKRSKKASRRGQQKIDSDRTRQIQEALIKQSYMSGEPSGTWDAGTEAALRKFQADNGWQNKTVPDSRALIKLGLGPSNDHLLNPDSAMTSASPEAVRAKAATPPTEAAPEPSQQQ